MESLPLRLKKYLKTFSAPPLWRAFQYCPALPSPVTLAMKREVFVKRSLYLACDLAGLSRLHFPITQVSNCSRGREERAFLGLGSPCMRPSCYES